jgi:ADP-heptose:LPS heptosyltransferase
VLELPRSLSEKRLAPERHQTRDATGPKTVLQPIVIRFGRLGDMVMMSAVLRLLHHRFATPCVVLGAGAWNSSLYLGHPDVARVWSFTRHFPFVLSLTWWRVLRLLRRSDPSPIYVLEHQPRQLARIRRMLASSGIDSARCLFITDAPSQVDEHWIDMSLRCARRTPDTLNPVDYPPPPATFKATPRLRVLDAERYEITDWLKERQLAGRQLVLIQPGNFRTMSRRRDRWRQSNADDKSWPVENWVGLFRKVLTTLPEAQFVLCGAPQEADMLREIQAAAAMPQVTVAAVPLRRLLALCESGHSMISIDTGPAHIAAAMDLPLVVMYGSESPARWLPRSASGSAVIAVGGPPASTRVDQLSIDDVFNAWSAVLPTVSTPAAALDTPTLSCESN